MAMSPYQVMNRNDDDKKKSTSSYNGTEDTNYFLAQQSNTKRNTIPDSWRNNPYVPSSNQIDTLVENASQPKEIKAGQEDAKIHTNEQPRVPEFVQTSFANKDQSTYQKSIDDVARGQIQRKQQGPWQDTKNKADYWTKRFDYQEQPTNNGVSGYIKQGGESIADSARSWIADVSSQLFNRDNVDNTMLNARLTSSENLDEEAFDQETMSSELNSLLDDSRRGVGNSMLSRRLKSSNNIELPEDNLEQVKQQVSPAIDSLYNAFNGAAKAFSRYAPQSFNRKRENELGPFSNATDAVYDVVGKSLFENRQQPMSRFNMVSENDLEDVEDINSVIDRELANFAATIPDEDLDNAKTPYEEFFLQENPNVDLSTENALFNQENLENLWEEAERTAIPEEEGKSQFQKDLENGIFEGQDTMVQNSGFSDRPAEYSQVVKDRAAQLYPDDPSKYFKNQSGVVMRFLELFEQQLEDESIDDGTQDIGNYTSVWMTGDRYKQYLEQLGLNGRDIDSIENDGIYNKYQEYIDYGFIPYLPDDYSRIKFRAEGLLHAGEQIYGDTANIRDANTEFQVDLGDGITRNGKELYQSLNDFYDNIPEEDYATFLDPNADHTNHQLYVPKYAYIKDSEGQLQQVPGGQYRAYGVEGTDQIFVTFSDGFSYLFENQKDYEDNFLYLDENNDMSKVTEWVLCADPNMFNGLNKAGDNQGATGYLFGIDYVDEDGNTIPFWQANNYLNAYNQGNLDVYDTDFGPLGLSKPAHMVAQPTQWILNPSTYGENVAPLLADVALGSGWFMLPGYASLVGDYMALGGALSGGSGVEGMYHSKDNVYRLHNDDNKIDDEVAKTLIDNGFMTQEEIDEYNDYTPRDRALYMLTTGLLNQGEKVSEFITNKPLGKVKGLVNRIPNKFLRVGGNALLGAFGEGAEEYITSPLGEIGEWGWDYAYGNELKDADGNPILDSNGEPIRMKNSSFTDRISNSFNQEAADQSIAAGLFGFLLNALTSPITTAQERALRKKQLQRLNEAISNDDAQQLNQIYNEVTNQSSIVEPNTIQR